MKVRMLVQITGTRNDVPWPGPGEVLDLPEDEARNYIDNGYAEEAGEIRETNKEQPVVNRPFVEREPLEQAQNTHKVSQPPTKASELAKTEEPAKAQSAKK